MQKLHHGMLVHKPCRAFTALIFTTANTYQIRSLLSAGSCRITLIIYGGKNKTNNIILELILKTSQLHFARQEGQIEWVDKSVWRTAVAEAGNDSVSGYIYMEILSWKSLNLSLRFHIVFCFVEELLRIWLLVEKPKLEFSSVPFEALTHLSLTCVNGH